MQRVLSTNDSVLVIRIDPYDAHGWAPPEMWNWLSTKRDPLRQRSSARSTEHRLAGAAVLLAQRLEELGPDDKLSLERAASAIACSDGTGWCAVGATGASLTAAAPAVSMTISSPASARSTRSGRSCWAFSSVMVVMAQPCQNSRPLNSVRNITASRPVSRVLSGGVPSATAIPLGRGLLRASSNQPGRRRGSRWMPSCPDTRAAPIRSCSRWGLPCRCRCRQRGALLPHRFTLACAGCPVPAVSSLWHFPWGRPRRPLAATVDPWSPDFPPPRSMAAKPAHAAAAVRPAGTGNKGSLERQVKGHPARAPPCAHHQNELPPP